MYVGTGNPTPVLNGDARPGDNTWTNSIVALNPETGKLAWGFQATPHDTHDWDAAEVPVLVDGMFNGVPRKMMLQASRNGYFFVLDRTNGNNLKTMPFAAVNWANGVDKAGRPIPNRDKEPSRDGRLVAPERSRRHELSFAQLRSRHRPVHRQRAGQYGIYFYKPEHGTTAGRAPTTTSTAAASCGRSTIGRARCAGATNSATARRRRRPDDGVRAAVHRRHSGNALALRTSDGATLWHAGDRPRRQRADHLRARRPAVRGDGRRRRAVRVRAACQEHPVRAAAQP